MDDTALKQLVPHADRVYESLHIVLDDREELRYPVNHLRQQMWIDYSGTMISRDRRKRRRKIPTGIAFVLFVTSTQQYGIM